MPGKVWRRKSAWLCQSLQGENARFTVASIKISCCRSRPLQMDLWQDCICTNQEGRAAFARVRLLLLLLGFALEQVRRQHCLAKVSSAPSTQPSSLHFPELNFWLLSLKNIFSRGERERRSAVSEDVLPVSLRTQLWI